MSCRTSDTSYDNCARSLIIRARLRLRGAPRVLAGVGATLPRLGRGGGGVSAHGAALCAFQGGGGAADASPRPAGEAGARRVWSLRRRAKW